MAQYSYRPNKREHNRHIIQNDVFVLLRQNDFEILGSIQDISDGGLCLFHIDENEVIDDNSLLSIQLISDKVSEQFNGKSVWSKKEEGGFATALVKMKHRGIKFEKLNEKMQAQLEEFIEYMINK